MSLSDQSEKFRRRMEQAASLASADPLRLEVERELSTHSDRAKQYWQRLQAESDLLRQSFADMQPPDDLAAKLLETENFAASSRLSWPRWKACGGALTAVAAVVVLIFLANGLFDGNSKPIHEELRPQQLTTAQPAATPPPLVSKPLVTYLDYQIAISQAEVPLEDLINNSPLPKISSGGKATKANPWPWDPEGLFDQN